MDYQDLFSLKNNKHNISIFPSMLSSKHTKSLQSRCNIVVTTLLRRCVFVGLRVSSWPCLWFSCVALFHHSGFDYMCFTVMFHCEV